MPNQPIGSISFDTISEHMQQELNQQAEKLNWPSPDWASKAPKTKVVKKTVMSAEKGQERIQLLKVGADVEEFLRDKNGNPVPVIGLIGGTKWEPMQVIKEGYALQEDNVALEYNIPPASNPYEFVHSLLRIREEIEQRVSKLGLVSAIEASMRFDAKQLEHPQAKTFGCEPDYNVWERAVNPKPSSTPEAATLRTAGAHVHVSFLVNGEVPKHPENVAQMEEVVMGLDIFVGTPFSLIDKDKERRKLYGKAGAFRPKPYGIEYRVLSNHWTRSPLLMAYVFNQTKRLIEYISNRPNAHGKFLDFKEAVYKAINDGDESCAHAVMDYFSIQLPKAA